MKKIAALLSLALACTPLVYAQDASDKQLSTTTTETAHYGNADEKTALDLFNVDGAYVFESKIDNNGGFGKQSAIQSGVDYSHRFLLHGKIYLRAGFEYHRFDFSQTFAPLPSHLQSASAIISLEYMVGNDVGAFLQFDPGFYFENDIDKHSFDVPITLGRAFILKPDKLFLFVGVNAAFLRGEYPVLPLVGIVYRPNEQWTVNLVPPDPRLIYSPNKKLDLWVGGQITGWSYRTDRSQTIFPQKLNGAQVDYSEYRAGAGFTWHPCDAVSLDIGGGYAFERRFNFDRAGEEYKADPAPYVRVALKGEF